MRSRGGAAHSLPIGEAARLPNSHLDWGAHAARVLAMEASPSRTFVFPLSPLQFAAGRIRRGGRFNESRGDSVIIVRQVWD